MPAPGNKKKNKKREQKLKAYEDDAYDNVEWQYADTGLNKDGRLMTLDYSEEAAAGRGTLRRQCRGGLAPRGAGMGCRSASVL